jgi:hypothetical protein
MVAGQGTCTSGRWGVKVRGVCDSKKKGGQGPPVEVVEVGNFLLDNFAVQVDVGTFDFGFLLDP